MKADANNEAQGNGSGEVKADEHQHGALGNQQEAGDRERETETNPERALQDRPLPEGEGFTPVLGIELGLQSILERFLRSISDIVHPKALMAAKLEWVVHRTLPRTVLEDAAEENLDEAIMTHYKEKWPEVRKEIELATSRYLVDQDSKEAMNQALSAHEHGLYRLVPRAMMTEIERTARVQLHEKLVGSRFDSKKILDEVDALPLSCFNDLTSATIQYEIFEKHLYEQINNENDLSPFKENAIPNRHATVHGLVPYASEKSSLNSIFLADFVFLMITQMKKEKITEGTS